MAFAVRQVHSSRAFEEDVGISSFGLAVVKTEGSPISYDSERQGFITRYQHVVYALGFIITREIMEDDQYDIVGQRKAQGLAFSMRQTKEIVAANVYNRAFNSSILVVMVCRWLTPRTRRLLVVRSLTRSVLLLTCRKLRWNKRVSTLLASRMIVVC
jgi:hypothetical protein